METYLGQKSIHNKNILLYVLFPITPFNISLYKYYIIKMDKNQPEADLSAPQVNINYSVTVLASMVGIKSSLISVTIKSINSAWSIVASLTFLPLPKYLSTI